MVHEKFQRNWLCSCGDIAVYYLKAIYSPDPGLNEDKVSYLWIVHLELKVTQENNKQIWLTL